jgi:anaerobic selenocysteine-containing dehydrogenase
LRIHRVKLGVAAPPARGEFPLMGMIGRPSVVHFAGVTQWTGLGKQLNGVRFIQIHPAAARRVGVRDGEEVVVESPRGAVKGTALLWEGIREDTIFVPNTFGPMQQLAQEYGTPLYEAANTLLDDRWFDNLSGQQAYKCFACRVRKA